MRIMNDGRVRAHLVGHRLFTLPRLEEWIAGKSEMARRDAGCLIRGISVDGEFAGWCGIQKEDDGTYGLGIILGPSHWGAGRAVFEDMLEWSRELGHQEVFIHLLSTRPESRALTKRFPGDCETVELEGATFRRYRIRLQPSLR